MLRRVLSAAAAGALAGVRSRSPVVGVLGLCWMWQDVAGCLPPCPPPHSTSGCTGNHHGEDARNRCCVTRRDLE